MNTLIDRVRRAIEREALLPPGSRVLAAVSGGADSVALLHLLRALAPSCGFTAAGLIHVNHGLRGVDSDADEAFCRALAARLRLSIDVTHADVSGRARDEHVSLETAGRRARYEAFEAAARRLDAQFVATGHTRDDQAETLLLRLLRGAGSTGLSGIRSRRDAIVRPLLDVRHQELLAYLGDIGESHREDASNHDEDIPRNWVRHTLIPSIADRVGAEIVDVLARSAHVLRDDDEYLGRLAADAGASVVTERPGGSVEIDAVALARLPQALARRVVHTALLTANGRRFVGFDHVEAVCRLAADPDAPASLDLPRVRVERKPTAVVLSRREGRAMAEAPTFRYELPVPGRLAIPESGCVIEARIQPVDRSQHDENTWVARPSGAFLDAAAIAGGLWVRSRRDGDAFQPFGMSGRRKVQDLLVDRKVPRAEREQVPVVVDRDDRILWVAGYARAEAARVTDGTQSVVVLVVKGEGIIS